METVWSDKKRWVLFALPWTFTTYTLDEDKLIIDSGLLVTKQEEILLYRVQDITLTRNIFQRMSNLGTITIRAADKSKEVKRQLSDLVEAAKDKKRVFSREIMGGGPSMDEYTI